MVWHSLLFWESEKITNNIWQHKRDILKIKSTFDEIATAIEQKCIPVGECDSPTTYANKIRSIAGSGTDIESYDFLAEVRTSR